MDPATFLGLILAFGSVYAMVNLEGASISGLLLPAPMILVFGATLSIGLAGSTLKDTLQAFKTVPKALIGKRPDPKATIATLVEIAEKARREGLLSLEAEAANTKDPFLSRALQNIADGNDPEVVQQAMEDEIATKQRSTTTRPNSSKTSPATHPPLASSARSFPSRTCWRTSPNPTSSAT